MTGLELIVAGLAVYRLARLVAVDSLWEHTRNRVVVAGEGRGGWRAKAVELLDCPYCASVWLTPPVLLAQQGPAWSRWLVAGAAVAGVAALAAAVDGAANRA